MNQTICGSASQCSIAADSPLTGFNETSLVNGSIGYKGCNDYVGWGKIINKLAAQYPNVQAVNMDDFAVSLTTDFTEQHAGAIRDALHGDGSTPVVKFIPTFYYDTNNGEPGGSTEFILNQYPWVGNVTDGVLFYFQNRKGGQDVCRNSQECGKNPSKSYWACLWDTCAEASLPTGLASEVADFAAAMPDGHELHVGLYFSGYGAGPTKATPSATYAHDALKEVLETKQVSGATVYTLKRPHAACPDRADEGCIVQEIFGTFSSPPIKEK
jgi:hypothetical protein